MSSAQRTALSFQDRVNCQSTFSGFSGSTHPAGRSLGTLTPLAERPLVGREGAVTGDPPELFPTPPRVATQVAVGAAVSWAPWLHSWGHRGSLFQVQGQPVQSQRPNAPQEASLSACGSAYKGNTANANAFLGVLFRVSPSR